MVTFIGVVTLHRERPRRRITDVTQIPSQNERQRVVGWTGSFDPAPLCSCTHCTLSMKRGLPYPNTRFHVVRPPFYRAPLPCLNPLVVPVLETTATVSLWDGNPVPAPMDRLPLVLVGCIGVRAPCASLP